MQCLPRPSTHPPYYIAKMAPSTRSVRRFITPDSHIPHTEYDTPRRVRFYHLYDNREPNESGRSICRQIHLPSSVGAFWLQQRQNLGSPSVCRTRLMSTKLGRPCK